MDFLDLSWYQWVTIRTGHDRRNDLTECIEKTDGILSRLVESKSRLRHIEMPYRGSYKNTKECVSASDSSRSLHSLVLSNSSWAECLHDSDSIRRFCLTLTRLTIHVDDLADHLPNLGKLILNSQKLVSLTLVPLNGFKGKQKYQQMCSLSENICANPIMRELSLIHCSLTDECVRPLINIIQSCSYLTKLNVSRNPITMIGIFSLLDVLKTNETLLSLELDGIDLPKIPSYDESTKKTYLASDAFEHFLTKNRTLISLSLAHNDWSTGDVHSLVRGLQANRTLAHLDLSEALTNTQLKLVADGLCTNNSLIGLSIDSETRLEHTEIQSLANLIRSKTSKIRMLNLRLRDENAAALILQALKDNRTLTHLGLDGNEISDNVKMLLSVINANHILASIHLCRNELTPDDIQQIQQTLRRNTMSDVLQIYVSED